MIKVRKADKKDLNSIKEFMLKIIKDEFGYDFNKEWHWDIEELENTYIKGKRSTIYIAVLDNEIIGTIAVRPYDRDYVEFRNRYNKDNTLSIWRHYIRKDMRGNKVGSRLLEQIELFAKDRSFQYIYLHTQKSIKGSLEYWLAKGYQISYDTNDSFKTVHLEKFI